MSIRYLDCLFKPASVAVVGASDKPLRIGTRVLANLVEGGFGGAIWPLNPRHDRLQELPCFHKVAALPAAPSLAILCTPPATIPGLIAELGARGTRAAIVMTAALGTHKAGGRSLGQAMLEAARPHGLRILGPGSVGLLAPAQRLNASFTHIGAATGKLAFVSQSGALGTAVLDWASLRGIGFSQFIAMGEGSDIDFGDLLDYLAEDNQTNAILLCIEQLSCARKFMSAGRLAARGKPVIVLKVGRDPDPDVELAFDAAIRRAGMLRVYSTEDLFDAVETLARARNLRGERLAVLTNGVGLGLIAADALRAGGAQLAELSEETVQRLRQLQAPPSNPVDLLADVPVERYTGVLDALLREPQADALLFLHAPTAMVPSSLIAEALAPLMRAASRNVLSCWLGGRAVSAARQVFAEAGLPTYETPEKAVHGFLQIVQYRRNQELLMEVPASVPAAAAPERAAARALVAAALAAGHTALAPAGLTALLAAYGIALQPQRQRRRAGDLALIDASDAADAGADPDPATPEQRQICGPADALEQALAATRLRVRIDPVFGPVILFGQGGVAAQVSDDRSAGLPPLNMVLARDMVERTRVASLLAQHSQCGPANIEAICRALVQLGELVADLPELAELDINPVLADAGHVWAQHAQLRLAPAGAAVALAIRPYPQELEQTVAWQERTILLRPIRPEDAPQHLAFFSALDPDDVRLRFFTAMRELPPSQLARLTQIDYDRAMAFIATEPGPDGSPETLGVVRAVADADNHSAEFAIIVRSALKGTGLGRILFQKLVDYFRSRGTVELVGDALSENHGVQHLVRRFGGVVLPHPEAGMVMLRLPLQ
ncbi:MAG: GNAT family N-acetyltransferase [Sphingomonadaceae bacterium]